MADFTYSNSTIATEGTQFVDPRLQDYDPPVALSPTAVDDRISLSAPKVPDPQNETILNQRATKYDYALGSESPGRDYLLGEMRLAGGEERSRMMAEDRQWLRDRAAKLEMITEVARQLPDGKLSREDEELIFNMTREDMKDPGSYFERQYSKRLFRDIATLDFDEQPEIAGTIVDDTLFGESMSENPELTHNIIDAAESIKVNQELDLRRYEDGIARWNKESGLSTAGAYLQSLVPFLSWYRMSNLLDQSGVSFLGTSLKDTYKKLNYINDPVLRRKEADRIFNELYSGNPLEALMFAGGLVSYGGFEEGMADVISAVDLSVVAPVGLIKGVVGAPARLLEAVKGVNKATSGPATNPALAIEATGNIERASEMAAMTIMENRASQTGSVQSFSDLIHTTTSLHNPEKALGNDLGHTSREAATRIVSMMESSRDAFMKKAFDDAVTTARLVPGTSEAEAAKASMRDLMNTVYGQGSDVVIDVELLDPSRALGNAQFAAIKLGRKNAELFDTAEQAVTMGRDWYGLTDFKARTQGGKYYIEVLKPLDETSPSIMASLRTTTKGTTPQSLPSVFLHWFRGKDYLLPKFMRENVLRGTMGGQALMDVGRELWKPIGRLSRSEEANLNSFMNKQRDFYKDGNRGRFSDGLAGFEKDWMKQFGKLPTEKETTAYFAARTFNDLEFVANNLSLYRDKARKGFEMWDFIPGSGARPSVEGVLRKPEDIWSYPQDKGIAIIDDNGISVVRKNFLRSSPDPENPNAVTRQAFKDMLASGQYRVVEITDVGEPALARLFTEEAEKFAGGIDYVVTKYARSGPLSFQQIPFRDGWHVQLQQGWMARQANIKRPTVNGTKISRYYGDKNVFHFVVEKDGINAVQRLNHIRELWKAGNRAEIIRLVRSGYLPMSLREVARLFGGRNPKLDVNEPVVLTRMNQNVEQAAGLSRDTARNPNWSAKANEPGDLYEGGIGLQWTGERGGHTFTIRNDGSTTSPMWNYTRAEYIDSSTVLERAMNFALRDRYTGDLKHVLGDRFVAEFGDVLATTADKIRANPLKAMLDGQFRADADPFLVRAAKNYRRAAMEVFGLKSDWEMSKQAFTVKMQQQIYERMGTKRAEKLFGAIDIVDDWTYGMIKDPSRMLRKLAFSFNLGQFNPAQMFVQGMTFTHGAMLVGAETTGKSMRASWFMRAASLNEDHLMTMAKKSGWNTKHFIESYDMARRLNWFRVGREYAAIDDVVDPALRQTRVGMVDDFGKIFFRAGEGWTRRFAWNAAYLEWRAANPAAEFTNLAGQSVLKRADNLSVNMTSASNAMWQKGWPALPTQFWGYQARLLEQIWGDTLTAAEKRRLLVGYSMLYGLPVAAGAPVGVWEVHNSIREWAARRGYNLDENAVVKTLSDGMLSLIAEVGNDGEQTNVAERLGPVGLPFLEDIVSGKTGPLEQLLGAEGVALSTATGVAGSTAIGIVSSTLPIAKLLVGAATGQNSVFDITNDDILDVVRTSASGNAVYNFYTGMALGKFYSKKGDVLDDDVTPKEAVFRVLMGVQPMRISDMYRRQSVVMKDNEYIKSRMDEATKEFKRGIAAIDDPETQLLHYKRAQIILDLTHNITPAQRAQALTNASKDVGLTRLDKVNRSWMDRGPEETQRIIDEINSRKNR